MLSALFSFLGIIAWLFFVLAGALCIMLYCLQNRFIYIPNQPAGSRFELMRPSGFGFVNDSWEEVKFRAHDGVTLCSWLFRAPSRKNKLPPTILYLHGNAGSVFLLIGENLIEVNVINYVHSF